MTNLKATNTLAVSLLVIALNTSIPNIAFAGGTTGGTGGEMAGGDNAGTTTTMGDGQDDGFDMGWIGLLGLLGLLGLKGRDNNRNRV